MASLMNLIAALAGYNKVQGGPSATTDPTTGEQVFTYNPATSKKGFLKHWGTGDEKATELNARIGGEAFLGQEEGKRRIQQIRETGEEERKVVGKRGEEDRLTRKQDQLLKIFSDLGIPFSEKNLKAIDEDSIDAITKVFRPSLSTQRIRNAQAYESIMDEVLTSPEGRKAAVTGGIQQNLAPLFRNQASTVMTAPPNTVGQFRDIAGSTSPLGDPKRIEGKEEFNTVTQTGGIPMTDKETGEQRVIGGDVKATRGYRGGGVFPIADPNLIKQAESMTDTSSTMDSATEIETLKKLLKKYPQVLQRTNTGGY